MSLDGVGAFASGLSGGLGMGMQAKDARQKKTDVMPTMETAPGAPQPGTETGYGLGQSLVSGGVNAPAYAEPEEEGGGWSTLAGILGGLGPAVAGGGKVDSGMAGALGGLAAGALSGGKISDGKLGVGLGLGGALLGKLFK